MKTPPEIDEFLFGKGLHLENYFIEQSPVAEMIGYVNAEGRAFDLAISDTELASESVRRLKELGVRVVRLG